MEKRVSQRFKDLKVGDKVVSYVKYSIRYKPYECTVTKVGTKYITTDYGKTRYDKVTGISESNYRLFPGSFEEYREWMESQKIARNLLSELQKGIFTLTSEELTKISNILHENHES